MQDLDIPWQQRFMNFKKALAKLSEVFDDQEQEEELSELEVEGMIQRFEYTFELAWKTLQDLLRFKGYLDISGPSPVLEQAFQDGYIADAEGWKAMKKSREISSHTYNSEIAEEIAYSVRHAYYKLLTDLAYRLEVERYGSQSTLFD